MAREILDYLHEAYPTLTDTVLVERDRAEQAEARLRTATKTLCQIIEWSSDATYGAGMIDIERAARDGLALITRERTP